METISFAKSLRHYDLKPNMKGKKASFIGNPGKRRSLMSSQHFEEINLTNLTSHNENNNNHHFLTLTTPASATATQRATSNTNSITRQSTSANQHHPHQLTNRRSMPTSVWQSTNETFVDKMSDQRIFDRQFRIENVSRDTRLTSRMHTIDAEIDLDDEPLNTNLYIISKGEIHKRYPNKSQKTSKGALHLPTLDRAATTGTTSANSPKNVKYTNDNKTKRGQTGVSYRQQQQQQQQQKQRPQQYNTNYSDSIESITHELHIDARKQSSKTKESEIFEKKLHELLNAKIKQNRTSTSINVNNKNKNIKKLDDNDDDDDELENENHINELLYKSRAKEINDKKIQNYFFRNPNVDNEIDGDLNVIEDIDEDAKHNEHVNKKCTEWLDKWSTYMNSTNDESFVDFNNFYIE